MDSTVSENGGIANLPPNDLASTPDDWAGEIGEDGAPGNSVTPGQITDDMIPEDVPSGLMRPNRVESLYELTEVQTERLNYAKMLGMNGFRILELRVGSKKPVGGRGCAYFARSLKWWCPGAESNHPINGGFLRYFDSTVR